MSEGKREETACLHVLDPKDPFSFFWYICLSFSKCWPGMAQGKEPPAMWTHIGQTCGEDPHGLLNLCTPQRRGAYTMRGCGLSRPSWVSGRTSSLSWLTSERLSKYLRDLLFDCWSRLFSGGPLVAYGILVPWPGIEHRSLAVQSL